MKRAYSPWFLMLRGTRGFAPGWHEGALSALAVLI